MDAINDKNVLPFRVDYISTMKEAEPDIDDKQVADIDREKAFLAPKRVSDIVTYILTHNHTLIEYSVSFILAYKHVKFLYRSNDNPAIRFFKLFFEYRRTRVAAKRLLRSRLRRSQASSTT